MTQAHHRPLKAMLRHWPAFLLAAWLSVACAHAQTVVRKMRADGPNAQALGFSQGYPSCVAALQQPGCRDRKSVV